MRDDVDTAFDLWGVRLFFGGGDLYSKYLLPKPSYQILLNETLILFSTSFSI